MGTETNLDDYLSSLGFDPDGTYEVPDNPADAALASVSAFISNRSACEKQSSTGVLHIAGPSVLGHAAPVKSVGNLLTTFQSTVDSIGASLMGIRSVGGAIRSSIARRTEMSLIASPMPGSVVLQVAPSLPRIADLYPEGPALFDLENEVDAKPLADQAFIEFSALIGELNDDDPDDVVFIDHLTDLGPRVAAAMKGFCETVNKGVLDLEFEWTEPGQKTEKAVLSHSYAERAAKVIERANIETEEVTIEGTLLTVTQSSKDKLRILQEDGGEVVVALGYVSPAATRSLHTGERVRVLADKCVSHKPGGKRSERFVCKLVEPVAKLDD